MSRRDRTHRPARLSRRDLLKVGSLGLLGIDLPRLLAANDLPASRLTPRADACIIIFLNGGPSHLDMWDMKPEAPEGIRGEFNPITTSLRGYTISEHLPRLATHMHRATVIRSMHHGVNNAHAAAVYAALTGHDRGELGGGAKPTDNPTPGAVLSLVRPPQAAVVPHVTLPYITKEGAAGPPQPGFFGGYLGAQFDPLFVTRDPNAADFTVPELSLRAGVSLARLDARRALFERIDAALSSASGSTAWDAMSAHQRRAVELLTSPRTRAAFQMAEEPDAVRESYGRNIYGQSVLLARRLIEAGTRLACVSWAPDANATWDTHGGNFSKLRDSLLPQLDAALASLIGDLAERGMLERTLVAVMGDFGRSPKINQNAGRDHWNYCYSLMLVGGGIRSGLVYGASDKTGAFPADRALQPAHVVSTIYHLLGVPHDQELHDRLGRPHRLVPTGEPVGEIMG